MTLPSCPPAREFQTDFELGIRVLSVLAVDGKAWLFNELSHVQEKPDRTDVYVWDPHPLRIVDAFNLEHPFPTWWARTDEETIYIFHRTPFTSLREAGYRSEITRLDLDTPCLAHKQRSEGNGLWCMNVFGGLELTSQKEAVGVLFRTVSP